MPSDSERKDVQKTKERLESIEQKLDQILKGRP